MNTHNPSRHCLLGGLLASLTAWLCPRPSRAPASPPPTVKAIVYGSHNLVHSVTYCYDAMGRLVSVIDHPPQHLQQSYAS